VVGDNLPRMAARILARTVEQSRLCIVGLIDRSPSMKICMRPSLEPFKTVQFAKTILRSSSLPL
jgi:hypothetical protein